MSTFITSRRCQRKNFVQIWEEGRRNQSVGSAESSNSHVAQRLQSTETEEDQEKAFNHQTQSATRAQRTSLHLKERRSTSAGSLPQLKDARSNARTAPKMTGRPSRPRKREQISSQPWLALPRWPSKWAPASPGTAARAPPAPPLSIVWERTGSNVAWGVLKMLVSDQHLSTHLGLERLEPLSKLVGAERLCDRRRGNRAVQAAAAAASVDGPRARLQCPLRGSVSVVKMLKGICVQT